jgi:predicted nucleic acid-binding protein
VYFDTCYIAKFYFNEPESQRVRELVRKADTIHSSVWAFAEFHAVLHRRLREGTSPASDTRDLASLFSGTSRTDYGSCTPLPKRCCGEPAH